MIDKAVEKLNNSEVIAIPTETVYGLAARIDDEIALNKIFTTKQRPFFNPLIIHVASLDMARDCVSHWPDALQVLAQTFWPGPLTLILPKNDKINPIITASHETVGIRMPNHPLAIELIKKIDCPLAAPSANKFKKVSPTNAKDVINEFNGNIFVLDGGQCSIGIESTIVGIEDGNIVIYRPGSISKTDIEHVLINEKFTIDVKYKESPISPGHLKDHYQPNIPIILSWDMAYAKINEDDMEWFPSDDPAIVARVLYSKFREAENLNARSLIIQMDSRLKSFPSWAGILNRLDKAKSYEY